MDKQKKHFLMGSGAVLAAIAGAGAAAYVTTKRMVKIALDREEPEALEKGRKMIRRTEDYDVFLGISEAAADNLASRESEEVEITSHDGIRLVGHWRKHPEAKRIIVAMHGWRSSWAYDFGMISDFLEENGCSVLYAEQRGQNNSGGDYMTFGMLERFDCLNWIDWVRKNQSEELPIYLAGVSMGATTVLMASGLELPGNVKGIVADCGFTTPHEIWKHVVEDSLHLSYGIRDDVVESLCRKKTQLNAREYSTLDALKECKVPVLFIHGTEDKLVPVKMTYENYMACAAPKRLLIVPGADHAMSYYKDRIGYEANVKSFWNAYDN